MPASFAREQDGSAPGTAGLTGRPAPAREPQRQRLFAKYMVHTTAVVCIVLAATNGTNLYLSTRRSVSQTQETQHAQAVAAAAEIGRAIGDIANELRWVAMPSIEDAVGGPQAKRLEFVKLLREWPQISELSWFDDRGLEQLKVSRESIDRLNSGIPAPNPLPLLEEGGRWPYFSPVHYSHDSAPYMTIAVRPESGGLVLAELNLEFVGPLLSHAKVGEHGVLFVTDAQGTVIAHPDIAVVLQKKSIGRTREFIDSLHIADVAQRKPGPGFAFVKNMRSEPVLASSAPVAALGWHVFAELPREEVLAPLQRAIYRDISVMLAAVLVSVLAGILLGRRLLSPIRALQAGAAAIGAGQLDHRIDVRTGDEIESLASDFNLMTQRLRESYSTLEQKVAQRTAEVSDQRALAERADRAKTRFLAAASHDLRQPMHALNLYLGALSTHHLTDQGRRVLVHVQQCATAMSGLLEALLDISRLDAEAMDLKVHGFRVADLLARLEVEFQPQARAKGLQLRVARSSASVCSDEAVVERIMRNLITNAIRHSPTGAVLVGCRRVGASVRLAVYDQGPGIPSDQHELIFEEFYQLANPERDRTKGLGLGLSIVTRLAALLDTSIVLKTVVGRGSMFGVDLPWAAPPPGAGGAVSRLEPEPRSIHGALVMLVDDDGIVLNATRELLIQWGCEVVACPSAAQALAAAAHCTRPPDLLICDYRLPGANDGLKIVERLRDEFNLPIPALIVTGDVLPGQLDLLHAADVLVLHKPVSEATMRQTMEQMLGG